MMEPDEEQVSLIDAIKRRDVDEVRRLLAAGGIPDDFDNEDEDTYGHSALEIAAESGYSQIVRLLLDARADPNIAGYLGHTPLMSALNLEIASMLIDAGANPLLKTEDGETALDMASEQDIIEFLTPLTRDVVGTARRVRQMEIERRNRIEAEGRKRLEEERERMKSGLSGGTVPPRIVKRALGIAVEDDDLKVLHAILNNF